MTSYTFKHITMDEAIEMMSPPGPATMTIVRTAKPRDYRVTVNWPDAGVTVTEHRGRVTVEVQS